MEIEKKERVVVGVNDDVMKEENEVPIEVFKVNPEAEKRQIVKLEKLRKERDNKKVSQSLEKLKKVAKGSDNLYPSVLEAVDSYATVGEICDALREVFGQYDENTYYL